VTHTLVATGPTIEDRPARGPLVHALPAYLPALLIALGGWSHRWANEDAFINFRVIDNLFAGHGPVFNAGERVEAATSPLWIGVLAVGRALLGWVLGIEWIAVVLCLAAAVGAFSLAGRGALLAARGSGGTVVPVGPLAVASVAVVWDFATSGLEMSLVWLWLGASWYVLCRVASSYEPSRLWRAAHAAIIGLAPLVRPDLAVMMVCFATAWFLLVRPRRTLGDLAAMFALPLAYQVFRMGYYASLVPSTALAKDAGGLHLRQGGRYLLDFIGPYHLWLPVALILVTIGRRLRLERDPRHATVAVAMLAAAALHGTYIVAVGGDYMHGRLLLPAFFALGLPAFVVVGNRALSTSLVLCAATSIWALAAIGWLRPPVPDPGIPDIADRRMMSGARIVVPPPDVELSPTGHPASQIYDRGVRGYIRALAPEPVPGRDADALVVTLGSIGIPAYQLGTDVWVIDIGGLAEPLAARTDPLPGRPAGHRKQIDPAWYDARFGIVGDDPAAQAGARALECGPVESLLDAVSDPLTPGRFVSNIWHSVSYTRLRIPADPADAVTQLCPR
jgi:arabinofuranosyltransferase